MSTAYYICRKHEHERSEAIINYIERIRRSLLSYLDASLPPELKDDVQRRMIWKTPFLRCAGN